MVPSGMTSRVHTFDAREGGTFRISLTYDTPTATGKTSAHTDTHHGRFVKLVPNAQIVEVVEFETADPTLQGEMTITISLTDTGDGTELAAMHEGLPSGLSAADNEAVGGCRSRTSPHWSKPADGTPARTAAAPILSLTWAAARMVPFNDPNDPNDPNDLPIQRPVAWPACSRYSGAPAERDTAESAARRRSVRTGRRPSPWTIPPDGRDCSWHRVPRRAAVKLFVLGRPRPQLPRRASPRTRPRNAEP